LQEEVEPCRPAFAFSGFIEPVVVKAYPSVQRTLLLGRV
jgi:hypothetical protein